VVLPQISLLQLLYGSGCIALLIGVFKAYSVYRDSRRAVQSYLTIWHIFCESIVQALGTYKDTLQSCERAIRTHNFDCTLFRNNFAKDITPILTRGADKLYLEIRQCTAEITELFRTSFQDVENIQRQTFENQEGIRDLTEKIEKLEETSAKLVSQALKRVDQKEITVRRQQKQIALLTGQIDQYRDQVTTLIGYLEEPYPTVQTGDYKPELEKQEIDNGEQEATNKDSTEGQKLRRDHRYRSN
jgi:hypothetical protein